MQLYRIRQIKLYTIDNISKKNYASFVNDEVKLLSVAEVAKKLGVTRARINQFINEGRLPAIRIGRSFAIKEENLSLVEERKVGRPSKIKNTE